MLESLYQFSKIIREIVKIDETNKKLKIMIFPFPFYLLDAVALDGNQRGLSLFCHSPIFPIKKRFSTVTISIN
jgi:hypothetical protein